MTLIEPNSLVLFQGDSITDGWRDHNDPNDLGKGYAMMAASWFTALYPEKNVRFLNRGVSGNRVVDLKARLKEDCIDLKPAVISILIGINDCWRNFDRNDPTTVAEFESHYRAVLDRICSETNARLILLEPFVLPYPEDRMAWREDLDPKIHVVRELAREYKMTFIPLDGVFAQYSVKQHPKFWANDGVHPTSAGHALIAQHWLKAVGEI